MESLEQLTLSQLVVTLKELTGRLEELKTVPQDEKMVLTPKEAMKVLDVGTNTMYEVLLKDDNFPHFTIGRNIYIPKLALQEWVNKQWEQRLKGGI